MNCSKPDRPAFHAMVRAGYSGEAGAILDGKPIFASIGEALSAVPEENDKPFIIFIQKGHYYEKLKVNKPHVHFIGESRDETIITYDATGDTPDPAGGTYGTWGCSTLQINAPDFFAENLTIENGFDYPTNASKTDDDPTKVQNPQAVALMTSGNSDRAVFRNCIIRGYQDTLFPNVGRQYFQKCIILGHVDFIFGAGQAVFENCDIMSRNRSGKNPTGYITAPSTSIQFPYGFLFLNCRLLKEDHNLPAESVRLGRPWHPNADRKVSGSAVFVNCYMDNHIGPEGYAKISSRDTSGNRIWFELEPDSRFFEYASAGPGAIASPMRPALDEKAVKWYTAEYVFGGWSPPENRASQK
ncbi:MAG: pectinesterase A [bacterium]|nr:MAG: pectinesterase A [bacterium]